MKTPQVPALPGMSPLGFKEPSRAANEKTLAERRWTAPLRPPAAQLPCDRGLFSDNHLQADLIDQLRGG